MAEIDKQAFQVWREVSDSPLGAVLEAAPVTEPGARVTVWPGEPPAVAAGVHPLVAAPIGHGEMDGQPCWIEDRPPGIMLADLTDPLSPGVAAQIVAQMADALGALHARGHSHGHVSADRVVVALDGSPVLIGAGISAGTPEADLAATLALLDTICPEMEIPSPDSAAEIAASLREVAMSAEVSPSVLRERIELAMPAPPADPTILHLSIAPLGFTDEVQPDLGPDERVRGLLERWSTTGSGDEFTGDRTEAISASELAAQARRVMLARLGDLYNRPTLSDRFQEHEGTPCEPMKSLIADEPLDPLPVPDGVTEKSGPQAEPEHSIEVTAEAPHLAEFTEPSDPASWTGGDTTVSGAPVRSRTWILVSVALVAVLALSGVVTYLYFGGP